MATYDYLWHIESANPPQQIGPFPLVDQNLYTINLDSRQIQGPSWLSVKEDHKSELLYFTVDRFYDGIDLSDAVCVVQYETISRETQSKYKGVYYIPYYDLQSLSDDEKMILVWQIKDAVSQSATLVNYNFRFYKIDPVSKQVIYNLNTLPTTAKILDTISAKGLEIDYETYETEFNQVWQWIQHLASWQKTNWEIL